MSKDIKFGDQNPIQKILHHIIYKRGGFGTPDFEEGFLGLSSLQWCNYHSRLWRIVDWFKWKTFNAKLAFTILKRPNKIGSSIRTYNETIDCLEKAYEEKENRVYFLEDLVSRLIPSAAERTKDGKRTYDYEEIKEQWEKVFGEYSVPTKYKDPNEEKDHDCHCHICEGGGDNIAHATYKREADYNLFELKQRGLYVKKD